MSFAQPQIMGVLNITPDSFSDGGELFQADTVILDAVRAQALAMIESGAQVLDIPVGLFEKGRYFDAILVDHPEPQGASLAGADNDGEDLIQSLLYNVSRSDIRSVWVNGRLTHCLDAALGESIS